MSTEQRTALRNYRGGPDRPRSRRRPARRFDISVLDAGGISPLVTLDAGRRYLTPTRPPPHRRPAHRGRGPADGDRAIRRAPEVASDHARHLRAPPARPLALPGPGDPPPRRGGASGAASAGRASERRWWRDGSAEYDLHAPVTAITAPAHPRPSVILIDHQRRGAGRPEVGDRHPGTAREAARAAAAVLVCRGGCGPLFAGAHAPETRAGRAHHHRPPGHRPKPSHHLHQHRRPHPTGAREA